MTGRSDCADRIKAIVTMPDAIGMYTGSTPRHSRIPCPLHGGKHDNLWFNDTIFCCFVCGIKGDVIAFTQKLFDLSFMDAIKKLNDDFGVGIVFDRPLTIREKHAAMKARKAQLQKAHERKVRVEAWDAEYWAKIEEYIRLEAQKQKYAPKSLDEEVDPRYIEACVKLESAAYAIDCIPERPVVT